MNASVASQKKLAYLKGLTNQNGEDLVNLCVSNNFETTHIRCL